LGHHLQILEPASVIEVFQRIFFSCANFCLYYNINIDHDKCKLNNECNNALEIPIKQIMDGMAPLTANNSFVVVMNIINDSGEKQNA